LVNNIHCYRRENIHEMKRYQKRDNRILQNLESQLKFSLDDLEKKFKQEVEVGRMMIDILLFTVKVA